MNSQQGSENYSQILKDEFSITEAVLLTKGMQSVVFDVTDGTLAKLYKKTKHTPDFKLLQNFYSTLDTSRVQFEVPHIIAIHESKTHILVIEAKLPGRSLERSSLQALSERELKAFIPNYVDTLFSIRLVHSSLIQEAELLIESDQFFVTKSASWKELIQKSIVAKDQAIGNVFNQDVIEYSSKLEMLRSYFTAQEYDKPQLIHGDYFPGNMLVDEKYQITSMLDFGTLTTKGDYLFDIATGWQFADMYREVSVLNLNALIFAHIQERLQSDELSRVHAYLLFYSLISANMYSASRDDGHYVWCVENWNNTEHWSKLAS
ncbi:MAG: aminoglycoside phosphotransferase family protein [Patescibacteria group bacterium]